MPKFWDSRGKVPNKNARTLIDLSNDIDGRLKANNPYHKEFGQGGKKDKYQKDISEIANALDTLVETTLDLETSSVKRWFRILDKYASTQYQPRFIFKSHRSVEERKIIEQAIEENLMGADIADRYVKKDYIAKSDSEKAYYKIESDSSVYHQAKEDRKKQFLD